MTTINKIGRLALATVLCAVLSLMWRLTADGQVPIIASYLHFNQAASLGSQGGYLGWNQEAIGETDFMNMQGTGVGGFCWFNTVTPNLLGCLDFNGKLTTSGGFSGNLTGTVTGSLIGNVSGNASTASLATLATTATTADGLNGTLNQCSNGATGIANNGDAICVATALQVESLTITTGICTTTNTAYALCGPIGPYSWPTAFADSNYAVTCTPAVPTSTSGGSTVGTIQVYIENISASTVSLELQNGSGNGAGANTVGTIFCTAKHN